MNRIEDFGHEYAPYCPRGPTYELIQILRREHPEMETFDNHRTAPKPEQQIEQPTEQKRPPPEGDVVERHVLPKDVIIVMPHQSIIRQVAVTHQVAFWQMKGRSRHRRIVRARNEAMSKLYEYGLSLNKIGQIFGRDHTTALSNVRRHRFEANHEAK